MTRVAFLVQLPRNVSPGQRFRIEQYEPKLKEAAIEYDTFPFLDESTYSVLYQPGHRLRKVAGVLFGFFRRCLFLLIARKFDYIFLQREASPIGPPLFEFILTKILRRKVILDFDDAIWIPTSNNQFANFIRCFWKVRWICRMAHCVSVGNEYLANYALRFNDNVIVIPTSVDTADRYNRLKSQADQKVVIGWTGSHSTLKYLDLIYPVILELEKKYEFEFLVICNAPPAFSLRSLRFIPWRESTEIADLLRLNIGVMPLEADSWSEGKCGFKLIQYLSLGIPSVASPVGVNKKIIDEGQNGFLSSSSTDWYQSLSRLIEHPEIRAAMGRHGREKIVSNYSLDATSTTFLRLFGF